MVMGSGEIQMTAGSTKPETNRLDPMDVLRQRWSEGGRVSGLASKYSVHCTVFTLLQPRLLTWRPR